MTESAAKPAFRSEEDRAAPMRAAVDRALAVGPGFLRGEIDADTMATAMVQAVRGYTEQQAEQERAAGAMPPPTPGSPAAELRAVLAELLTCGSGYLAGRCDADCVARTITYLVGEYAAG